MKDTRMALTDTSYAAVMARRNEIMKRSVGIDYEAYATGPLSFDYEKLMEDTGYDIETVGCIQAETAVGNTPMVQLKNLTALARTTASAGMGGRIFVKDEAQNPSGSFKDRRASLSVYEAKKKGYKGVVAATSGNYGAAVASQAAKLGLKCIIVQEAFDSHGVAQPEIAEKTRACEAYGAEVIRLSVGPELFYVFLLVLAETGYFNASLYTPYSILGIETLGAELVRDLSAWDGGLRPDVVVATHAGGGNITGTGRGLEKAGAAGVMCVGASVDLAGLHMASDMDFNRKSFTTGHTGFGIPFATWPDRADVPRNAARPLRYMDRFVTVTQGEVFYITQALAELEGMERGPAGNTSLTAAFALAREMEQDTVIVVQETEYTGAGKHPIAQLNLAKRMGVKVRRGDPEDNVPGKTIVIPEHPSQIHITDVDMEGLRMSYMKNAAKSLKPGETPTDGDVTFLAEDCRGTEDFVRRVLSEAL